MKATLTKHFDYLTPFEEAENDRELEEIMRLKYPKACSNLEVDASFFARMVDDVRKFQGWRVIGLDSFEQFCTEKLGRTLDEVEAIVVGVQVLRERGNKKPTKNEAIKAGRELLSPEERGAMGGRGNKASDNITSFSRGTSQEYLAARIKRDHPDIVSRIEAGEFTSIRAAALEAGIVKPTATIRIDTPEAAIDGLLRRFTFDQLERALAKHG